MNSKRISGISGYIIIFLLLTAVPLYLHDSYFDLVTAKAAVLHIVLFVSALLSLVSLFLHRKETKFERSDIFLLSFSLLSLLSSLLSYSFADSFFGNKGWGIGSLVICLSSLVICSFKDHDLDPDKILVPYSFLLIFLFGILILHAADIDVFSLHELISSAQYYSYYSLLGNTNWINAYLCLLIPVYLLRYAEGRSRYSLLYFIVLCFLIPSSILINCDSFYAGALCFLIVSLPHFLRHTEVLKRCAPLLSIYGISLLFVRLLPMHILLNGVTRFLSGNIIPYLLMIAGPLLYLFCSKYSLSDKEITILTILFEGIFILMAVFIFLKIYQASINYDYYFGNNRLRIWKETLFAYKNYLSPLQKVFGLGPEMQASWSGNLSQELIVPILSTHSEILQVLFTMGIAGLILYILLIKEFFSSSLDSSHPDTFLYVSAIAMYLGQSFFNSPEPLGVSLLIVLLSLWRMTGKKKDCHADSLSNKGSRSSRVSRK